MQNIDWNIYRHSKFLQSLSFTLNERKYLNLFLKRSKFENLKNIKNTRKNREISDSRALNPSKYLAQEKVGIDI